MIHRLIRLTGSAVFIVKIVVEEKLVPAMSFCQVVPLQWTKRPRMQPFVAGQAKMIRFFRVITWLNALRGCAFAGFTGLHGRMIPLQACSP